MCVFLQEEIVEIVYANNGDKNRQVAINMEDFSDVSN